MEKPATLTGKAPAFRDIYTVTRLNREAKAVLETGFAPVLWVEGEISNLARPASGHLYFSLKDEQAHIRCALFRPSRRQLTCDPVDGMQVLIRARVSLYETRGEFQLIVEHLEDAGEGALRRSFEALKQRLGSEGLFDLARKKPLPRLPRRIGIITSPSGAVLHDILTTLARRFPAIPVLLYPVPVQGQEAAEKIAGAITLAGRRKDCNALILARGGGSLEDLWAFNQEAVARAIYASTIPIVCGVGHETDFTIADLVADHRAPTPTAAAEILSPDQNQWLMQYQNSEMRLIKQLRDLIQGLMQRLDWLSARLIHPRQRLALIAQRLSDIEKRIRLAQSATLFAANYRHDTALAILSKHVPYPRIHQLHTNIRYLCERLTNTMRQTLELRTHRLQRAGQGLNALSPLATLGRGYAIITRTGTSTVIKDTAAIKVGNSIEAKLHHGRLECSVEKIYED